MSQDTDLTEAVRIVTQELNIPVGLVWLDGHWRGGKLLKTARLVRQIVNARLTAAQFPLRLWGAQVTPYINR